MKPFLILFLLTVAFQVSAQGYQQPPSRVGADTLLMQTTYTDLNGVERTALVKTARVVSYGRSGPITVYYSLDPKVLDSHVRRRVIPETTK